MQNGGFPGLLASLGIPLISSLIDSLMRKGLQIDRARRASRLQVHTQTSNTCSEAGLQIDSAPRTYWRILTYD